MCVVQIRLCRTLRRLVKIYKKHTIEKWLSKTIFFFGLKKMNWNHFVCVFYAITSKFVYRFRSYFYRNSARIYIRRTYSTCMCGKFGDELHTLSSISYFHLTGRFSWSDEKKNEYVSFILWSRCLYFYKITLPLNIAKTIKTILIFLNSTKNDIILYRVTYRAIFSNVKQKPRLNCLPHKPLLLRI